MLRPRGIPASMRIMSYMEPQDVFALRLAKLGQKKKTVLLVVTCSRTIWSSNRSGFCLAKRV